MGRVEEAVSILEEYSSVCSEEDAKKIGKLVPMLLQGEIGEDKLKNLLMKRPAALLGGLEDFIPQPPPPPQESSDLEETLKRVLEPINHLLIATAFPPKSASSNQSECKPKALKYYCGSKEQPSELTCSVSGEKLPAASVRAGHIIQQQWPGYVLAKNRLSGNSPHNILFMHKSIEDKFDNFQLTVLPVTRQVVVLKSKLFKSEHSCAFKRPDGTVVTWKELDGRVLVSDTGEMPSDVALHCHASVAIPFAVRRRWIGMAKVPTVPTLPTASSQEVTAVLERYLEDQLAAVVLQHSSTGRK
mmetsp:Transcript_28612/g.62968  ORF Transcript_28612/g.62968 Transcript_28612/m.62968 type:complete len:301 (+) Transcript_28612:36-938(+)|eukprot:CAMPEP_0202896338 /NCGR_PEP_ID=MMETSP1392-20130828/5365_1 /ASSEMBLY_ACC=CAM_ASM_000868 /TAXON_ID=225041 /ORGANISM="Chlamydomonas chlamydogama, Strain SAG 11-48b" /LENGTH=300 /DNA_ID=CAMNT_0049581665 /DNA_START=170 /DNA_END=1072 /DNA_ORIENTATION=+